MLSAAAALGGSVGAQLGAASGFEVRGRGKQTLVNFCIPRNVFWGCPWPGVRDGAPSVLFGLFYSEWNKLKEKSCVGTRRVLGPYP